MQALENLSRLDGAIVGRRPHPSSSAYDLVSLRVVRVGAVPGKANLLAHAEGNTVDVTVRRELLGSARPGDQLRCRAQQTPDGPLCEPHPAPADFEVRASAPP